jgi:hypothetical protein
MFGVTGRSPLRGLCLVGVVVLLVSLGACGVADAVVPGPAWSVQSIAGPTNFIPGYSGEYPQQGYRIYVTNVGSRASNGSPVKITDTLPEAQGVTPEAGGQFWDMKHEAYESTPCGALCVDEQVVPPGDILELQLPVHVSVSAPEGPITNTITVSGGGAPPITVNFQNTINRTTAPFAIKEFGFGMTDVDGAPDTQAGSHPYGVSTTVGFTTEMFHNVGDNFAFVPSQAAKDIVVDLPLGLVGSTLAAPQCPLADLEDGGRNTRYLFDCPADTQVGNVTIETIAGSAGPVSSVAGNTFPLSPVYNLVPEHGHAAEFGFVVAHFFRSHIFADVVHTPAGYVLRVTSPEIPEPQLQSLVKGGLLAGIQLSFFGDPGAEDGGNTQPNPYGGETTASAGNLPVPNYTNPTDCSGTPLAATLHVDSWQHQGRVNTDGEPDFSDPNWLEAKSMLPATTGCGLVQFNPSFTAGLETTQADSPTGLQTNLEIQQAPNSDFSLATADLKSTTVALPAGLALSPSAADGLQACSDAQFAEESTQPATCPEASQIGTAVAHTRARGTPRRPGVHGRPGLFAVFPGGRAGRTHGQVVPAAACPELGDRPEGPRHDDGGPGHGCPDGVVPGSPAAANGGFDVDAEGRAARTVGDAAVVRDVYDEQCADAVVGSGVRSPGGIPQLVRDRLGLCGWVRARVHSGHHQQPGRRVQPVERHVLPQRPGTGSG